MTNDTKPGKIHTHLDCIDGLRFAWSQKKKGFFANKLEMYFVLMVRERDQVYDLLAKVESERDAALGIIAEARAQAKRGNIATPPWVIAALNGNVVDK